MDDIRLMEMLKGKNIAEVCSAIIELAQNFCLAYCHRNDCQHTGANIGMAAGLRDDSGKLVIDHTLVNHPYEFGQMRFLLQQVLMPRGLKPPGMNPYDKDIQPVEWKQYATADGLVEKIA